MVVSIKLDEVARDQKLGGAEGDDGSTAQLTAVGESNRDRTEEDERRYSEEHVVDVPRVSMPRFGKAGSENKSRKHRRTRKE